MCAVDGWCRSKGHISFDTPPRLWEDEGSLTKLNRQRLSATSTKDLSIGRNVFTWGRRVIGETSPPLLAFILASTL